MEFLALDTGFSKHSPGGELMSDWVASDVSEKVQNLEIKEIKRIRLDSV